MKALGPLWGVGLILDRNLLVVFLLANLAFALLFVLVLFRGRRALDQVLITLGIFLLLTAGSLVGLHAFARTPVRDVQFFVVD